MTRILNTTLMLLLIASTCAAADDENTTANSAAEQYKQLVAEFEESGGADRFAERFLKLAKDHAEAPAAVDALLWVVEKRRSEPEAVQALELLEKQHLDSEKLGAACRSIARIPSTAAEKLLGRLMQESAHQEVQARASFCLASLLQEQVRIVEQLSERPDLADRVTQYYGKDYGEHLRSLDRAQLDHKSEQVYEQMQKRFGGVSIQGTSLGELAEKELFRIRHLSVGKVAPEIEGEDIFGNEFKLSDYRGKVVMLSFWGHW